jgi:hypothetical protein
MLDVETEVISSPYAQVNWRVHQMPIDAADTTKLKGKLVNFVGYEFDIRKLQNNTHASGSRSESRHLFFHPVVATELDRH